MDLVSSIVLLGASGASTKGYFAGQYQNPTQYRGRLLGGLVRPEVARATFNYVSYDGSANCLGVADIGSRGVVYYTKRSDNSTNELYSQKLMPDYKSVSGTYYYVTGTSYDDSSGRAWRATMQSNGNFPTGNWSQFNGLSMNSEAAALMSTGDVIVAGTDKNGSDYVPYWYCKNRYFVSGGSQRQATSVQVSSSDIAFSGVAHTSQGCEVHKFNLTGTPSASAGIKYNDFTTDQNALVDIAINNSGGFYYVGVPRIAGVFMGSMSTNTGVRRVTAFGTTLNPGSITPGSDNCSVKYGLDGHVYFCYAYMVRKMSADLTTCVWSISLNTNHLIVDVDSNGDVWIIGERNDSVAGYRYYFVSKIDSNASQVPTSWTNVVGGMYWQRYSSTVTTSTSFSTSNAGTPGSGANVVTTSTTTFSSLSAFSSTILPL
jgi:hypothetical protein